MIEGSRRLDRSVVPRRPWRRLGGERLRVWRVYLLSFITIFGLWHVMATHVTPSVLFAPPLPAALRLWHLAVSGILFEHLSISLWRIATGFSIGSAIGILVGLVMGNIPFLRHFLEPYVNFFRFIPGIALITVAVIWFGIGETSKVFLIIYATVFMVIINTMVGVLSIPQNKIRAAQCLGASPSQIFFFVSIPATVPYILTGMRIAMQNSFAVIVSAEMLGATLGIGQMIWTARLFMLVEDVFVALIVLGLLGFTADRLFVWVGTRFGGKYGSIA